MAAILIQPPCDDISPPIAAYMRQWSVSALLQVLACRLNQWWLIVNWTLRSKFHWNSNQNTKLFIHKHAFENVVYEMATILSSGRWINRKLCSANPPPVVLKYQNAKANLLAHGWQAKWNKLDLKLAQSINISTGGVPSIAYMRQWIRSAVMKNYTG